MREFKFRAWKPEIKNKKGSIRRKGRMFYSEKHEIEFYNDEWNIGYRDYDEFHADVTNRDCYENGFLMQWSGLVDKNGKDIYEGDIVKFEVNHDYFGKCEIVFNEVHGGFYIKGHHENSGTAIFRTMCYNSYCEVVGNVFENKELLG